MFPRCEFSNLGFLKIKGPTPKKRIAYGYCSGLTDKEKRKMDSCPVCGKSMYAFKHNKY